MTNKTKEALNQEIPTILDHMVYKCNKCGCVSWHFLRSRKLECAECGDIIEQPKDD